ncbi:hypothetical protein GCM10025857_18850 [Alicyclobacillus contaminans]|nr:hypothetical protein GCM10025857_18850 [Alicyclobacillus contaminans]
MAKTNMCIERLRIPDVRLLCFDNQAAMQTGRGLIADRPVPIQENGVNEPPAPLPRSI